MSTCGVEPVVQGDVGQTKLLHLTGVVDSLAAVASYVATVRKGRTIVQLAAATYGDPEDCNVLLDLEGPDNWLSSGPAPGGWSLQLELTFVDTDVVTWPNDGNSFVIPVVLQNA